MVWRLYWQSLRHSTNSSERRASASGAKGTAPGEKRIAAQSKRDGPFLHARDFCPKRGQLTLEHGEVTPFGGRVLGQSLQALFRVLRINQTRFEITVLLGNLVRGLLFAFDTANRFQIRKS